ncbi:hypothetical protein TEA_021171 [Camellia sinensis var. sinensis]|uniref:Major facilitator superfamily (MFS) profile domain-containing protein n=1 Tax=Camellia sinensis var. sinensis TaxID=542762 RepID=A0A4S4DHR2_CAMSN|nr:hypothetical protein TEA_021171 [Camellia sinensis var. sinensis]
MAKFTFTADHNLFCLSHQTPSSSSSSHTSIFNPSSLKRHHLRVVFPSKPISKFAVSCSIKEKENVKDSKEESTGLVLKKGLQVDDELELELEQTSVGRLGDESSSHKLGFDWTWPPWKNVPLRYKIIGTTSLAFVICNMDKVNLSIAIIPMSHQFGWSSSVAGLVQSSFFWGYALSQLPGGWLAKTFGGRKVLEIGVLIWSLATALVPVLAGFMPGLVLSRILCLYWNLEGSFTITAAICSLDHTRDRHFLTIPLEERSRAVSFVFGGLSVGSVAGFSGFQFLEEGKPSATMSWPQSVSGKKSWNNSLQELGGSIKDVPWKAFFRSEAVWAMIYVHFCGSWGHYTCLSWLPTYFSEELNLNLTEAAWVSVLPPLASIFVTSIAAQFADNLIVNGVETTTVRKICQTIAFLSPATCMILSSLNLGLPPWEVVAILTGGLALSSFALSGLYCTHQDISPEYASILLGITNTVGAVPGIVGVALTGYLLDSTHSWSVSLFAPSIFFYLTGTIVWLAFASSKPQSFSESD